jgi:ElaB/YqjD/DUF883 family membrane-anchored ribosome-binding protein
MTSHQNDELDEMLRVSAQDYNRPSEAPRDRMWSEIRTRRAEQRLAARTAAPAHIRHQPWFIPAIAAAVLVIGIALGRGYERWTSAPDAMTIATVKPESVSQVAVTPRVPDSEGDTNAAADVAPSNARTTHSASATLRSPADVSRSTPNAPRSVTNAPRSTSGANLSYRLAVVQHLAGTEAMLTSFRAAAKRGDVDAQITNWARNLLTTTRLLQSSAAQQDPTMKRLLDDLELVLVQIAQYTSTGQHHAEELELIEHSIERRGVIGKLQTTTPARLVPSGT